MAQTLNSLNHHMAHVQCRAEQRSADRNASLLDTNIVMSLANMSMNR